MRKGAERIDGSRPWQNLGYEEGAGDMPRHSRYKRGDIEPENYSVPSFVNPFSPAKRAS